MSKKERQAVWLYPETKKLIDTHMSEDNCKSQSEYIEKAVKFYTGYLSQNGASRSELIESALRLFLVTRTIKTKSEMLVPELAECISAANDEGITKISKGLFRYAVEVEMLIALLAETFEVDKNHLKEVRREAVNNVRRTRGKINLDDLIMRNEREGIIDSDEYL